MAGELQQDLGITGKTIYFLVRNANGLIWNGSSFASYVTGNYATYPITGTEQGTSGFYVGDMPGVAAGTYSVVAKQQAGGSPAETDFSVGSGNIQWGGSTVQAFPANFASLAVTAAGGVTLADAVTHGGASAKLRLGTTTTTPALQIDGSAGSGDTVRIMASGIGGIACNFNGLGNGSFGLMLQANGTGATAFYVLGNVSGAYGFYIATTDTPAIAATGSEGMALLGTTGDISLLGTGTIQGSLTGSVGSVSDPSNFFRRSMSNDEAFAAKQSLCGVILKQTSKFDCKATVTSAITYQTDGITPFFTQIVVHDTTLTPIRSVAVGA